MRRLLWLTLILALVPGTAGQARRRRDNKPLLIAPNVNSGRSYYPWLKWRVTLGMAPNTVAAVADLELDGVSDIILPAVDGDAKKGILYRLSAAGDVKWKVNLPAAATAGVVVGDIDRDGSPDILVACGKILVCYDAHAREEWRYLCSDIITSFPTIADIDCDGKAEVLVGANDNKLHVLKSDGLEKWSFTTKSWIVGGVAVADIQGDGKLEIVFGSMDFNIYYIDCRGKELWHYATNDWVQSSPCLGDIDGDGGVDVIASSDDGYVYCLSRQGTLKWKAALTNTQHMRPYLVVTDLDGNGQMEALAAAPDGTVKVFSCDGDEIWKTEIEGGVQGSPLVADMDGDGVQDILLATPESQLVALNIWGSQQWALMLGQSLGATPLMADLDRDGKYEIYVANLMRQNQDSGFFSQYEMSVKGGAGRWLTLKGDPYRTGATANALDYARALARGTDYATSWEPFGIGYRPRTGVQSPRQLLVKALPLYDVRGNRDGALDPGETAIFKVQVSNHGKGPSYDNLLTLSPSGTLLRFDRRRMYLGWIAPGATKTVVFHITAPPLSQIMKGSDESGIFRETADNDGLPTRSPLPAVNIKPRKHQAARAQNVLLQVFESGVQAAVARATVFNVPPLPPTLKVEGAYLIDSASKSTAGNGNGRLDAGESVVLRLRLRNVNMTTAKVATVTLRSTSHDVLVATPTVPMTGIRPLESRQVNFGLRVARQLKRKRVTFVVTTYAAAPLARQAPPHSDELVFSLRQGAVDTSPPAISFAAPRSRITTTTAASLTVIGALDDVSGISSFRFDKRAVSLKLLNGTGHHHWRFYFVRSLKPGENMFPLSATDGAGNTATQWIRVVRKIKK